MPVGPRRHAGHGHAGRPCDRIAARNRPAAGSEAGALPAAGPAGAVSGGGYSGRSSQGNHRTGRWPSPATTPIAAAAPGMTRRLPRPPWRHHAAAAHLLGPADRQGQRSRSPDLRPLRPADDLVAFVTDQLAVRRILDRLGLSTPESRGPHPSARSPSSPSTTKAESWSAPEPSAKGSGAVRPAPARAPPGLLTRRRVHDDWNYTILPGSR